MPNVPLRDLLAALAFLEDGTEITISVRVADLRAALEVLGFIDPAPEFPHRGSGRVEKFFEMQGGARLLSETRLEVALATGCRVAELGALEWSAFNEDECTVRLRWQVPPDGYGSALQPLKGRRNRTALVLPSWWAYHQEHRKGRVILTPTAKRVAHRSLEGWFTRIIEGAGLKRDRQNAHLARHTYARICLDKGARLEELQRFLGHASIRTTEQCYGWLTGDSATTLARARIYGEKLRLIGGKRHKKRHKAS